MFLAAAKNIQTSVAGRLNVLYTFGRLAFKLFKSTLCLYCASVCNVSV